MKRKLASIAMTALVAALLVPLGAQSASANTVTTYCSQHMYDQTATTAQPSTALYCQMQELARLHGYAGPINGTLGVNSWKGIQSYLRDYWNYTGPVNGVPGVNTYKAMQRAGNQMAWWPTPSAVDGTLETRDWQAWAYVVRLYITGN